jgi:glycosyltransferase involved in cell wall biosynthesis
LTGLVTRGVRVTLVSFGEIPLPEQTAWMDHLHGLDYIPTAFHLEWMQDAEEDMSESSAFLAALARELRPDLLHLHQFCYGNLPVDVPRVVMAHGDLITWSHAGHNHASHSENSVKWYRNTVLAGLAGADAVVAPSAWMLDRISEYYGRPRRGEVIYPGRNPIFFNPYITETIVCWPLADGRSGDGFLLTNSHSVPFALSAPTTRCLHRVFPSVRM